MKLIYTAWFPSWSHILELFLADIFSSIARDIFKATDAVGIALKLVSAVLILKTLRLRIKRWLAAAPGRGSNP